MTKLLCAAIFSMIILFSSCSQKKMNNATSEPNSNKNTIVESSNSVQKSDAEWKNILSPEAYQVMRNKGTERPFSAKEILYNTKKGAYQCAGCGQALFKSDAKFDAGCGWPSFYDAISDSLIVETVDKSHGMIRTEITCKRCGGHLGHVFDDGPKPTGLRYCVNGVSLKFTEE
jgi:peptide-methionine (R)-S-oxide reductase